MRTLINFNDNWLFSPNDQPTSAPDSDFEAVTIPHSNKLFPHHNFDNAEYQFISTYRKRFTAPEKRAGRRVFVDFDGAMIACTVWLNGKLLGDNEGGYTPFSFDVTDALNDSGENLLTVRLDSTERSDIPPFGFVVDYLTFGGIYRDVWLRYVEPCYISDVIVRTRDVLTAQPKLMGEIIIQNQGAGDKAVSANLTLRRGESVVWVQENLPLLTRSSETHTLAYNGELKGCDLWTLENPALYTLTVQLNDADGLIDERVTRFGFREARFEKDGRFMLNGQHLKLIGLNRHQTYPYIGAAAPARLQRKDADILKYELGVNIARTSHYPQSPYFLDRCDEVGLLVFEEIPGWQHIGDTDWQGISLRDVEAMIVRDRHHPSIVLWGVRINESQDNTAFYTATNALARQLDPTRQTGGVRYFQESEFLEDVFTFNDFSNSVREPVNVPHLVTEFNGHMYPTKMWDQEERVMEHALRHARVQDKQLGMPNVAGAIGWCAFDYNTHREFGSGDRICYHGVMDIFRLPKFAAAAYESQISPAVRPLVRTVTYWAMGDRSGGGLDPLIIFSNCEEVEIVFGDTSFGKATKDSEHFPNLAHPPFILPGLNLWITWGGQIADLHVYGLINGERVAEQHFSGHGVPKRLIVTADDTEINADGADMTRVVFKITDEYGNRLPYATQVVTFTLEGPGELIGENPFALVGGQAAVYVKAKREVGTITLRAQSPRLPDAVATIQVI